MNLPFFNKNKPCPIQDNLFLKISWSPGQSPQDNPELKQLVDQLDDRLLHIGHFLLEETLPYLTFYQAEILFQALQSHFGSFQVKSVSIAQQGDNGPTTEDEVFIVDFMIDQHYQNILQPLIYAILTQPEFVHYSYHQKREHFVDEVFPAYKASLRVTDRAMPQFPHEGELPQLSTDDDVITIPERPTKPQNEEVDEIVKNPVKKIWPLPWWVALVFGLFATFSLIFAMLTQKALKEHEEKLDYLYTQQQSQTSLLTNQHRVDAFARFFLQNYYSDNKDQMEPFLDQGDAKFTPNSDGQLLSIILEGISLEDSQYKASYIVTVLVGETHQISRLTFTVKEAKDSDFGYLVTSQPQPSDYPSSQDKE